MEEQKQQKMEEIESTQKEKRPLLFQEPRSKRMRVTHRVAH